ncbi:MAG: tetratricopeptide repeat protein [Anaerolineae bacterium]|nr:tetratricopeptide repeat protein [Anaerolineae bacterium]
MFTPQELYEARYYHAQHYMEQLQVASTLYREGGCYIGQALDKLEQDWQQIEQGQAWTASSLADAGAAWLCCQFPSVGADLLHLRYSVSDQMRWLEPALKAARQLGEAQAECDHLCKIGKACWAAGEAGLAVDHLQQALILAESIDYDVGVALAHYHLCEIAARQARAGAARQHAQKSLEIFEQLDDRKGYADALLALGFVDAMESYYAAADRHYQQSLAAYHELDHQEGEATALAHLGNMAISQRDFALAQRYFSASHAIYRQLGHQTGIALTFNRLGVVAASFGDFRTARERFEESLEVYARIGHQYGVAESHQKVGEIDQYTGNFEQAAERYQQALAIHRSMHNRYHIAHMLVILGNVMLNQNKFEEAKEWYKQGVELSREIDRKTTLATSLKGLGQIAVHHERNLAEGQQFFEEALAEAQAGNDLWVVADTLDELGQLALKMGKSDVAKQRLLEALNAAYSIEAASLVLNHIASFADYWAAVGQPARALELAHFVRGYPASLECTKEDMQTLAAQLEAELSPAAVAQTAERVEAKPLDVIVEELRAAVRD